MVLFRMAKVMENSLSGPLKLEVFMVFVIILASLASTSLVYQRFTFTLNNLHVLATTRGTGNSKMMRSRLTRPSE